MARSTGPVLAVGAITLGNAILLPPGVDLAQDDKFRAAARVVVGTGLLAGIFAVVEKAAPDVAVGLAWVTFATLMLGRVDRDVPSPTERVLAWWTANRPTDLLTPGR